MTPPGRTAQTTINRPITMEYPKFILTHRGALRLGRVTLHRQLLQPGESCYGGGYYEFDYASNRLILSGRSTDFGSPQWERFDSIVVPAAYRGLSIVCRTSDGAEEHALADILRIEYD